jgi:ATP-dependent protease ClpP protease subunit
MNKLIASLAIILTLALTPKLSVSSNETAPGTIILSKSNTLVLNGVVEGESVSELIAKAKELDNNLNSGKGRIIPNKEHLNLFLNTPGGSIQAGLELMEALKGMGRQVDTVTLFAASMGFQIAQGLGDRLILKNGVLMSHHAAGEFEGSFGGVHPSQVDSRYQLWLDRVKELDEQTVARTNGKQTYESYTKQYDHEMWLTGTKSVEQGYADRVVLIKCDATLSGVTTKHVNFMGLDISYDLDNCPINTSPMNIKINAPDGKSLTNEIVNEVKAKFMSRFENKEGQVLPLIF